MYLTDKQMGDFGEREIVKPFTTSKVQSVGYDLTVRCFCNNDKTDKSAVELQPLESVFVQSEEVIKLPNNMAATVTLRNSRIRQGLLLTAPVYHPGHHTPVFFRITNLSSQAVTLQAGDGLATVMFMQLPEDVRTPYNGTFQEEMKYSGLGDYRNVLSDSMHDVEEKVKSLKDIEKSIYGNVLAIMAIFVAAFCLINLNVSLVKSDTALSTLIVVNACTVGALSFLGFVAQQLMSKETNKCLVWCAVIAFIAAFIVAVI
jgi:deoxycytidine triphosphate deaminase